MAQFASLKPKEIFIEFKIDGGDRAFEFAVKSVLTLAIDAAINFLVKNFQTIIIDQLLFGGKGWRPLTSTPAWKWLTSPKGYAQLGFSDTLQPLKLLNVLRKSWTVKPVSNKQIGSLNAGIQFEWADLDQIYAATIHPAAGQLGLPNNRSWFQWVYAGQPLREQGFHFKKTGPLKGVRSSVIAGAEAGKMVKGGFWEVTPRFRVDIDKLWARNENKISKTIEEFMQLKINEELKI